MQRASTRLPPTFHPLAKLRTPKIPPHHRTWPHHPSSSSLRTSIRAPTRLARIFHPPASRSNATSHRPRFGARIRRVYDCVREVKRHTIDAALSHPTAALCAGCIMAPMVCGLGTFALALAVERVSKAFENWIDNKVLWMKEFPGTLVERGKSVARKGWLYFSRRSGEIGEVVILTGRRVAARLGEERAKWTEKWKGKGWFGKSNGKTEQWGGERYKKIQESMDWRKEKSGGGYLDQFSVKEGDEPKEQPGEKETKRSEVEGEWRTMAAEAWKSVKWDDKDGK